MSDSLNHAESLKVKAALLYSLAASQEGKADTRVSELEKLIHDAAAREHRRAAFNARDKACYRLGGAFEPVDGLGLDPTMLAGFLALGSIALLLLVQVALKQPDASIAVLLSRLSRSPAGRLVRAHGVWVRWRWLQRLYVEETAAFLQSKKGRDPKARWRTEKVTANQAYLIEQICLLLELEGRRFADRGDAFEWIKSHGGNPRFTQEPKKPDFVGLTESLQ